MPTRKSVLTLAFFAPALTSSVGYLFGLASLAAGFLALNHESKRCPMARFQLGLALFVVIGVMVAVQGFAMWLHHERGRVYVVDVRR